MSTLYRVILTAVILLAVPAAFATEEIGAENGLACTACHDKAGSRLLTDTGKYFEMKGDLDGFDRLSTAFGACTSCHVRKPGSMKLTRQGRAFAEVIDSMDELREWLEAHHPTGPIEGGPEAVEKR